MEFNGLSESQLDLAYFGMNQAIDTSRSVGTDLPFVVTDGASGRQLTWLENVTQAGSLINAGEAVLVHHEVLDSSDSGHAIPALVIDVFSDGSPLMAIAQPYRPGGQHRRFAVLGEPFPLDAELV